MYKFEFKMGNYFWDKDNDSLVRYGNLPSNKTIGTVNVAFPIMLTDNLLFLLNFTKQNGQTSFVNKNYPNIFVDSANFIGYFVNDENHPVVFLNDLQNELKKLGSELIIDETNLENYCKNSIK